MKKSMGGGDESTEVEGALRCWRVRSDGGGARRVRVRWVKAELGDTREGEGDVGVGGSEDSRKRVVVGETEGGKVGRPNDERDEADAGRSSANASRTSNKTTGKRRYVHRTPVALAYERRL